MHRATLMGLVFSEELAQLMMELTEAINRGHATFEHPRHRVRGWTTLDEVLGGMLRAMNALPGKGAGTEEGMTPSP